MKAIQLEKFSKSNPVFKINEVNTPEPKLEEVRVKVELFGINFADVMAGRGMYGGCPPLPAILGYECVGVIDKVGDESINHLIGKKVLAFTMFGSYAKYVCTTKDAIVILDNTINDANALALATQYSTAWFAAVEMISLYENDTILVHSAAGGVGTALIQIGKWKGCKVIGLTSSDEKCKYVLQHGADYAINYKKKNYVQEVKKIAPKGVQATFNAVAGKSFKKDKKVLATGGRILLFGAAERTGGSGFFANIKLLFNTGFYSPLFLMMKTQGVIGFNMLSVAKEEPQILKRCLNEVTNLASKGILKPNTSKIFSKEEINAAHNYLLEGKNTGKVGIKW